MRGYRKVLVAVNANMGTVEKGIEMARDEKTWVTVLKVIPPYEGDLNLTGIKNIEDALGSGGEKYAEEIRKLAFDTGALIKTRIEEGEIDEKIVEVAKQERCDVIIMGSQKRSFIKRLFGMNIVEKVISRAPCPVLVVDA